MSVVKYMILPAVIAGIAVIYWFMSYEAAGSVMLLVFALAMAVMGWILLPTLNDVGPTAPVDAEWHEREP
ncbi:MAG: hypothetical protein ACRDGV_07590 [Candidatus Limnocylindria bacterium]